jgi:ankyrin repeat protein
VVKILIGRDDVNPDKADHKGQTPLCCAAHNGHEEVVKMLLAQDGVNPNKPDKYGSTPLWLAAMYHHAGVVALLRQTSAGLSTA